MKYKKEKLKLSKYHSRLMFPLVATSCGLGVFVLYDGTGFFPYYVNVILASYVSILTYRIFLPEIIKNE